MAGVTSAARVDSFVKTAATVMIPLRNALIADYVIIVVAVTITVLSAALAETSSIPAKDVDSVTTAALVSICVKDAD